MNICSICILQRFTSVIRCGTLIKEMKGMNYLWKRKIKIMVAVILKVYAIVNAIIGCIIGLSGLSDSYNEIFNMVYTIFLGACIVVSFGIYAFGEVVQLLQDIKDGTKGTITTIQKQNNNDNDELPSI